MFAKRESLDILAARGAKSLGKLRGFNLLGSHGDMAIFGADDEKDRVAFLAYDFADNRIQKFGQLNNGIWAESRCEDDKYIYVGTKGGRVAKINKSTGDVLLGKQHENCIDCIAVSGDSVYAGVNGIGITRYDKAFCIAATRKQRAVVSGLGVVPEGVLAFDYCGDESTDWPPVRLLHSTSLKPLRSGDSPGGVRFCTSVNNNYYLLSGKDMGGALFNFSPQSFHWDHLAEAGHVKAVSPGVYFDKPGLLVGNARGGVMLFGEGRSFSVAHGRQRVTGFLENDGKVYVGYSDGKLEAIC